VKDIAGTGGEGGIRTPGRGVSPYNGLANRRLQPLGHLSGDFQQFNMTALVHRLSSIQGVQPPSAPEKTASPSVTSIIKN
jgi:hypothetical protein